MSDVPETALPEAAAFYMRGCNIELADGQPLYTADQMRAAIEAAVREQPKPQPQALHCPRCGFIWRPADVPTNGVAAIKTKGKNDSAPQQGDSAVASEGGSCVNAELLKALRDLEVGANTVDGCYTRNPGNFAAALRDLREYAEAARGAIAKAEAALSTAGAQRGESEQDETTSAKEQR